MLLLYVFSCCGAGKRLRTAPLVNTTSLPRRQLLAIRQAGRSFVKGGVVEGDRGEVHAAVGNRKADITFS